MTQEVAVGMLMALDFILITTCMPPLGFAIGAALIPCGTIFIVPYFFSALAGIDREGRFAALGPAYLIGGVAFGPLIAGLVGHAGGYMLLGWTSASFVVIGIAIASLAVRTSQSRSALL